MRRSELVRALARIPSPARPRADLEQVVTPPERAADLLEAAIADGGLDGRSVVDLGSGTGRLAIGAALLGARPVVGAEADPDLVERARAAAEAAGVRVDFRALDVGEFSGPADVVVMNPPFGAQRRGADRPFWDAAFATARDRIFAFSLSESRTFIARRAVARSAHVVATRPVPWELPRTFAHHSQRRVALSVDLWDIHCGPPP
ncbi:MAG TPA: 50S ribosomal protein L11 methyltransferase [Thermoplasmata archaeon]|nr:50S ribosomal protein L11 methyltransferase [Thermoplasmata archaeon]